MAIAVVPSLLVGIVSTGRNEAPQERRQVLLQARLEFDGAYCTGAAHVEDLDDAGATPDSLTIRATASVRSCISPALCVCSVSSLWKTMRSA